MTVEDGEIVQPEDIRGIDHVGQYDPRGVLLGCSCGWEGADIFAHVNAALYGGSAS